MISQSEKGKEISTWLGIGIILFFFIISITLIYQFYLRIPGQFLTLNFLTRESQIDFHRKFELNELLSFFPPETQKNITKIKVTNKPDKKFPKLGSLGSSSEIENIKFPISQYYVRIKRWEGLYITQMSSLEDAQTVFENIRLTSPEKYEKEKIRDKVCFLKESSPKDYAYCIGNNLIFEIVSPSAYKILSDLGRYRYNPNQKLKDLIEKVDLDLYSHKSPLIHFYISLKEGTGHFALYDLPQIGYHYESDDLKIIRSLDGKVFFVEDKKEAESRFNEHLNFLKSTVLPFQITNISDIQSIESIMPNPGSADYMIVGHRENILYFSNIRITGNFGSLPSMPYQPPDLPTEDTALYIKHLAKELYRDLVNSYSKD